MTETANTPSEPDEVDPVDATELQTRLRKVYDDATPEERGEQE